MLGFFKINNLFFFEVALLEINNDFLTKIPKYNVGRMDRSSDSTIREKACSNLDLLFFLVDYLQEVNNQIFNRLIVQINIWNFLTLKKWCNVLFMYINLILIFLIII